MTSRKKRGLVFWAPVVVVVIGYALGFGPACWISSHAHAGYEIVDIAYRPIIWAWDRGPEPLGKFLDWYSRVGAAPGWAWLGNEWGW
jgi:hypothetical protein